MINFKLLDNITQFNDTVEKLLFPLTQGCTLRWQLISWYTYFTLSFWPSTKLIALERIPYLRFVKSNLTMAYFFHLIVSFYNFFIDDFLFSFCFQFCCYSCDYNQAHLHFHFHPLDLETPGLVFARQNVIGVEISRTFKGT